MQAARAEIGDNYSRFFPEEKLPPKAQRVVDRERAAQMLVAARLTAALYRTPRSRIMEKRKGGEEGRALRRFLILYARGIGSPVWECAEIFGLNRKQIGQEEAAYLDMLARNPDLESDAEHMISMLDYALKVDCGRFIRVSLSEIQADAMARKALKTVQQARSLLEEPQPKPKPKRAPMSEAERLVAEGQMERLRKAREQARRTLMRVIEVGSAPNATKEQRKDARKAQLALSEMGEA